MQPTEKDICKLKELLSEAEVIGSSAAGFSAQRLRSCVKIGSILLEWKAVIKPGQWESWLQEKIPELAERTRQRWMRLADSERKGTLDLESTRGLRHAYVLAGLLPDAPESNAKSSSKPVNYLVHIARLVAALQHIDHARLTEAERLTLRERLQPVLAFHANL